MESMSHYCPILDRRVKIKNEKAENNKRVGEHIAISQTGKKVCDGNCKGCSLM